MEGRCNTKCAKWIKLMNECKDRKKSTLTLKGIVILTRVTTELILNYQIHPRNGIWIDDVEVDDFNFLVTGIFSKEERFKRRREMKKKCTNFTSSISISGDFRVPTTILKSVLWIFNGFYVKLATVYQNSVHVW